MATVPFPPHKPTRVSLQLPNYRVLPNSWRSIEAPELLGNFPEGAILRLEYDNVKHDEALSLLLLSNATAGGKFAFNLLPAEIAAGIDDENFAKRILDIAPLVWALNTAVDEESIKNKRSGIVVELVSELRLTYTVNTFPPELGGLGPEDFAWVRWNMSLPFPFVGLAWKRTEDWEGVYESVGSVVSPAGLWGISGVISAVQGAAVGGFLGRVVFRERGGLPDSQTAYNIVGGVQSQTEPYTTIAVAGVWQFSETEGGSITFEWDGINPPLSVLQAAGLLP
jgi:hypothetical protein